MNVSSGFQPISGATARVFFGPFQLGDVIAGVVFSLTGNSSLGIAIRSFTANANDSEAAFSGGESLISGPVSFSSGFGGFTPGVPSFQFDQSAGTGGSAHFVVHVFERIDSRPWIGVQLGNGGSVCCGVVGILHYHSSQELPKSGGGGGSITVPTIADRAIPPRKSNRPRNR